MKNVFPLTNIVAIRNYLLCELLSNRYIPTLCSTDSWTECLALWIWFTSTVTVCRPAVLIDVSTRISSSPVPTTRCPFAINNSVSMWSAPSKAKYFGNTNSGYFIGLLCKEHILVDPNNSLLSLAENSRCLHIQYRVSIDNAICQVYVRHLLIMEKWNCSRV